MNKQVYYRVIALWVLCEAMLGGIIHGFKIPVSGLFVGSCAIICICLIAWFVPVKGAILKATIIVAVFKMMLSPQAPPPAYIAVFFQGLLGEMLFWNRRFFGFSCIALAVLALLESGLQRILVLTIVYGNDFWKVVNSFFNSLIKQKENTNYSLWIGSGYLTLHFITGIMVGWWTSQLPKRIEKWAKQEKYRITIGEATAIALPLATKRKKRFKIALLIIWLLLIGLYIQSYFTIGEPILPSHISLKILLRSFIIVLGWIFIIGPLVSRMLHSWLKKKQTQSQQEVKEVLNLLPVMKQIIVYSWKKSAETKGWKRVSNWVKMVVSNTLAFQAFPERQIYLFTGPVQTGKTTALLHWSENRNDVFGILTPVLNGKKMFMNAQSRQMFIMEAKEGEKEILDVGRFTFSKTSFDIACGVIRENIHKEGWLVIDEIGPLELRGDGFCEVVKEVLANRRGKILLIVRQNDNLPAKVIDYFSIPNPIIIHQAPKL